MPSTSRFRVLSLVTKESLEEIIESSQIKDKKWLAWKNRTTHKETSANNEKLTLTKVFSSNKSKIVNPTLIMTLKTAAKHKNAAENLSNAHLYNVFLN